MSTVDWVILLVTLTAMIAYGLYKSRGQQGSYSYLLADKKMPWYIVLLGIMATQASAITFLSAPGQAYTDGMRFVQYYFGLPLAMIVISVTFIPVFQRLNVFTAYEYLEQRFDRKTRLFTCLLFLLSRGLSTGISIYAPAIILSSIIGWNIYITNAIMGGLLLIYTYAGGARAVAHTQKLQFLIILASMAIAGYLVVHQMPQGTSLSDALYIAGKAGKLNVITTKFDLKDKYNIWSGLIGGFFLALSYFGTDQSQVGRYLSGKNADQSRMGLLMNGLIKIPMQFCILLIGALIFAFYSFYPAPLSFNTAAYSALKAHNTASLAVTEARYDSLNKLQQQQTTLVLQARHQNLFTQNNAAQQLAATRNHIQELRNEVSHQIADNNYSPDKNDTNYIFLYFVKSALPRGIVGLLFAVIILASWGSISAALNSLAASSFTDIQLLGGKQLSPEREVHYGRLHTLVWGIFCIGIAMFAARLGSLIEAVNVLGSLFYGTILGIFLVAFYVKKASGNAVFTAAIIAEAAVIAIYLCDIVSFLWLNVVGAVVVVAIAAIAPHGGKQH